MFKRSFQHSTLGLVALSLVACGGSGSASESTPELMRETLQQVLSDAGVDCRDSSVVEPPDGSWRLLCNMNDGNWTEDSYAVIFGGLLKDACDQAEASDPILNEEIVEGESWIVVEGVALDADLTGPASADLNAVAGALSGEVVTIREYCGLD